MHKRPMPATSDVFTEQIKDYDASYITVTVYCIIFVNLFFAVKDGYNNLFAGNCTRHDRTYNTYRGGRVSSLNNTLKLHSAIFMFSFFLRKKNVYFWLPIISGRIQDICSCVSQIGFVGTLSLQQTGV